MKTNVILKSKDRELFGQVIEQETKTSFLSVTHLQKAYEAARWQYGWGGKNYATLMQSDDFLERVYHLLNERDMIKVHFRTFTEMCEREGITKVLKGLGVWKTTGRGSGKNVMADPYIWVLMAMELNPMMYAKVVMWITDSLIFDRIDAGTEYLPMNAKIKEIVAMPNYSEYAIAINKKVFGKHMTGMRNLASAKQLREVSNLERFVIQSIDMGFIKTREEILSAIERYVVSARLAA